MLTVIAKVENLTGHASVAITNGKKRYIFDYHGKLMFEVRQRATADDDKDTVLAKGSLHLPDVCSTSHEELKVTFRVGRNRPKELCSKRSNNAKGNSSPMFESGCSNGFKTLIITTDRMRQHPILKITRSAAR
jgi:activator of HSP90 ATPase